MNRITCSYCKRKRSVTSMIAVYYKLLNKTAWHCKEHMSATGDILQIIQPGKKKVFLELFSGSKEISAIAGEYNYQICSVDIEPRFEPSICSNILKLNIKQLPKDIDFIWASIPCQVYSIMSLSNHWHKINHSFRQYYYYPKSPQAKQAIQILEKVLAIYRSVKPRVLVMENPRGALRHMPQMKTIPFRHTVSYSDYGFDYYKPTDLFTNYPGLSLHKIKSSVGQKFTGSIMQLPNAFERSKLPSLLVHSILQQTSLNSLTHNSTNHATTTTNTRTTTDHKI